VAGWDVYLGEVLVASFFLILLAVLNIRGVKSAGWTQTTIALGLVSTILLLTALILMGGVNWANLNPLFQEGQPWHSSVLAIVAMAPWAFIGFDCIPQAAEEYSFSHNKSRNLMVSAIAVAAVLYICVNTITAVGLKPWQELLNDKPFWATGLVVKERLGKIGLILLGTSMFCAVISGINAFFISTSRLMYAMAQDNALPSVFGRLHKKYGTPVPAIIFVLVFALVAPWFGREVLGWIVDMTSVGGAIGFLYTCSSAVVLSYRQKDYSYTVAGVLGAIISLCFLLLLLIPGSPGFLYKQAFYCLGVWVILGIVFYIVIYPKYIKEK
jgi:amino acid transporter